ncbi:hypothetical protein Pint_06827 [Pistacia integerrima]|uniref:Uncharacterized protein n=1 Tax=Pistacia integerrima TaxID=434235 RepID=A0ACC0XWR6_9ROSI|nr:hypothetical protein Pint_06827 [Pistacia integerrima]
MLFDAALALTRVFRHSNWERRFRSLATFSRQTFKYKFVGGFSHLVLVGYGYINNRHCQSAFLLLVLAYRWLFAFWPSHPRQRCCYIAAFLLLVLASAASLPSGHLTPA